MMGTVAAHGIVQAKPVGFDAGVSTYGIMPGGSGVGVDPRGGGSVPNAASTVAGGRGHFDGLSSGVAGDAVRFGELAGSLVVGSGAVFIGGHVVANAALNGVHTAANGNTRLTGSPRLISVINTAHYTSITAGAGNYAANLTITSSGTIAPRASGAVALTTGTGTIVNQGLIVGGQGSRGSYGGSGGVGVSLDGGTLANDGRIFGGSGGYGSSRGGAGAAGVEGSDGTLTNQGTIAGGDAGLAASLAGQGGSGVSLNGGTLGNSGVIYGGNGGYGASLGGAGGTGVSISNGTLTNQGTITGGYGAGGAGTSQGGAGGTGVIASNGALTNQGMIYGGIGGYGKLAGAGGTGVSASDVTLTNQGTIAGGYGNGTYDLSVGSQGGSGVSLDGGTLANSGVVTGGAGSYGYSQGGAGGTGVSISNGTLTNQGMITGGGGGGGNFLHDEGTGGTGVLASDGTLTNHGTIAGGSGSGGGYYKFNGGGGGIGVSLDGGTLTNYGVIAGGAGGSVRVQAGAGGTGVSIGNGTLTNQGTITGGGGGYGGYGGAGGTGVSISDGMLTNQGNMTGGGGGGSGYDGYGGAGGTGVFISNGTLTNQGTITAGGGGGSGASYLGHGGAGGTGVSISNGTLTNQGTITGGGGGAGPRGGAGGTGVFLDGGTLFDSGTIAGAAGGAGSYANGAAGDAVLFGTIAGTLVVDPGAVFVGQVVANTAASDVLELTGSNAATLAGIGTQFTGFSSLVVDAGADWTLAGPGSFDGTTTLAGTLDVQAGVAFSGGVQLTAAGASLTNDGTIAPTSYGAVAVATGSGTTVNSGLIRGGAGGGGASTIHGGDGGIGVSLAGGALSNYGTVAGGAGGNGTLQAGAGGTGVLASDGTLTNEGTITGGYGGFGYATGNYGFPGSQGGMGVSLNGGSLVNLGAIAGGTGADGSYYGGAGGTGVAITDGALTNQGAITGGAGGGGFYGGAGGTGVSISNGTLTNQGTITGGGGAVGPTGGAGGTGVYLDGGTLFDSGTIAGAAGGAGFFKNGAAGDAVLFGTLAGTLVVDPGAVFVGQVVADASANDALELAGSRAAMLAGLGTQFTGFSSLVVDAGADWTLAGPTSFSGTTTLAGTLDVQAGVALSGPLLLTDAESSLTNAGTIGSVQATEGGSIDNLAGGIIAGGVTAQGSSVTLANDGTITGTAGAAITLDGTVSNTLILSGQSVIMGDISALATAANTLELTAQDGPGTVAIGTGFQTITIDTGAAWQVDATAQALAAASVNGATVADTLLLSGSGTLGASASGFGTMELAGQATVLIQENTLLSESSLVLDQGSHLLLHTAFAGHVSNLGVLQAYAGNLVLSGDVEGDGRFSINTYAKMQLAGGFDIAGEFVGPGLLLISSIGTLEAGAAIHTNVVQSANLTLAGDLLINGQGKTYDLRATDGGSATISGTGNFVNRGQFTADYAGDKSVSVSFTNTSHAQVSASRGGTLSFLGATSNAGTMTATHDTLLVSQALTGNGALQIGAGGTIELAGGATGSQRVTFEAAHGTFELADPAQFAGHIAGFAAGDRIDLLGVSATAVKLAGQTLDVFDGSTQIAALTFSGSLVGDVFAIAQDVITVKHV